MADDGKLRLPGMDEFFSIPEPEEIGHDGKPRSDTTYFDAALLPDSPSRQKVAHGAQTYIMYIVFPSFEEMQEGLTILSGGNRKTIAKQATMTTISSLSTHKASGVPLIDWWKTMLSGETPAKAGKPTSEGESDEAATPVYDDDDGEPEAKPAKKPKKAAVVKPAPAKKEKKAEIPVVTDYEKKLAVHDADVVIMFPTYRRPSAVKTWKHFPPGQALACVEPQEYNTYSQLNEMQSIFKLPQDNMSIAQKRKWLVDKAIKTKMKWLFMLEDDLTGFFVRDGLTAGGSHKLTKSTYDVVMDEMLNFASSNNIAELGLSQQQSNHFYEETHVKYSCKITEFCLFNLDLLREAKVNYDPDIAHFEDFDIEIQLLQKGYRVGLYTPAAFGHVTMASNAGGFNADGMEARKELAKKAIDQMIVKYPGIIEYKEGRLFPEPKINWTSLRQEIK